MTKDKHEHKEEHDEEHNEECSCDECNDHGGQEAESTDSQKSIQQNYAKLQVLDQQIKQVQKQLKAITKQLNELAYSIQSLDEFKKAKKGTEVFVPVVTGIFAKAELKDTEYVNINVGGNVAVTKSVDASKKLLEEQFSELDNIRMKLSNDAQKMVAQAQMLQSMIIQAQQK